MPVPVPDLLQMTHPAFTFVECDRPISENAVPVYLDFAVVSQSDLSTTAS